MLQKKRLEQAENILGDIRSEIEQGEVDDAFKLLQTAVNCQIEIYRIVFKLNELTFGKQTEGET